MNGDQQRTFLERWPQTAENGLACIFGLLQEMSPETAFVPRYAKDRMANGPAEAFEKFCAKFGCSPVRDLSFLREILPILRASEQMCAHSGFDDSVIVAELADTAKPQRRRLANGVELLESMQLAGEFYRVLIARSPAAAQSSSLPRQWSKKSDVLVLLWQANIRAEDAFGNWWEKLPATLTGVERGALNDIIPAIEAALLAIVGGGILEPPLVRFD